MSPANALDQYYLAITLLITVAWQLLGFFIAWTLQFDKITDFTGGSNFFLLALVTLLMGGNYSARNILASIFQMLWASHLAGFLLVRVLQRGSDSRFDDIRKHFLKFAGFWTGQILWVWIVSLPLTILNSPYVANNSSGVREGQLGFGQAGDIIGIILFVIGFGIELSGDWGKWYWKTFTKPPSNKPCDFLLWRWSRHPPYAGEIILQWGKFALSIAPAISSGKKVLWVGILAPLFTMVLLLFGSGLPTGEKPTAKKYFLASHKTSSSHPSGDAKVWEDYKTYLSTTSILWPVPRSIYSRLPRAVKTWGLWDWPMYRFREEVDGKEALKEQRRESGSA